MMYEESTNPIEDTLLSFQPTDNAIPAAAIVDSMNLFNKDDDTFQNVVELENNEPLLLSTSSLLKEDDAMNAFVVTSELGPFAENASGPFVDRHFQHLCRLGSTRF